MSVEASTPLSGLVDAYRQHPALGPYDELVLPSTSSGSVPPLAEPVEASHTALAEPVEAGRPPLAEPVEAGRSAGGYGVRDAHVAVAETIEAMGLGGLLAARAEARTFVVDEGVVYGSPEKRTSRLWTVDPLPLVLGAQEWTQLAAGLAQRARLLDLILTDLYTERTLLRRRLLPAPAVLSHPAFTRQADRVAAPGRRQLLLTATDLGRDATGSWRVISDRADLPAGAGYAMVTRRIVSRVMAGLHRSSDLARLRSFFHTVTTALMAAAPAGTDSPRVVVLSPGSSSETAFDLSFTSTMLGFPVAEADDLVTSQGRVWLRAGDRLEPVDVVLRRVNAVMSDPLEFRGDSEIGLPGLIEAVRNGHLTLANPIGSGVLDNPALVAYLDTIAPALLGEELLLSSPQTWWCGEPSGLSHVLANLEHLVIKPISRGHSQNVYGWELGGAARERLAARLRAEPWLWCGQEALELSTAPVVTTEGLEPRRFVLRGFGVATDTGYSILPGGLGRVAGSVRERTVSSQSGLAKDVWVPSSAQPEPAPAVSRPRITLLPALRPERVAPRVAATLLAIGRHAEQAESTARLLMIADDLTEDHSSRPGTPGAAAMTVLNSAITGLVQLPRRYAEPWVDYLRRAALDPSLPNSVAHHAGELVDNAQEVRDLMSVDTWSVFGRLERTLASALNADDQLQPLLDEALESLLAYAGIMAQSMVRDSSWAFLDAGGRLARARHTIALLRATLPFDHSAEVASLVAESVLRACESIITHRRRLAAGTGPADAEESAFALLLLDDSNPRSVAHQLTAVAADLRLVGDEALAAQADGLHARLVDFDSAAAGSWLEALALDLARFDDRIAERHFVRQATRHSAEPLHTSWTQET